MNSAQEQAISVFRNNAHRFCGEKYRENEYQIEEIGLGRVMMRLTLVRSDCPSESLQSYLTRYCWLVFFGKRGGATITKYRVCKNGRLVRRKINGVNKCLYLGWER